MELLSKTQSISIGGMGIKLYSDSDILIGLDIGYKHFIDGSHCFETSTRIEIIPSITDELKSKESLVFETKDGDKKLWDVCKTGNGYRIIVYNPLQSNLIQQIALVSTSTNKWQIYCEPGTEKTVMPLSYPMGPLIMYYLTTIHKAILIHSSGIVDGRKGRLFSGFSGIGKSTMAGIWQQNGHAMINDDRLMLTINNGKVMMHNTPMFYDDIPKCNELNAIYLLKQTKDHCIKRMTGVEAISRLLAFCIQHGYDKQFIEHHLALVSEIYNTIPIYELGFKPDADVIDFIRSHD